MTHGAGVRPAKGHIRRNAVEQGTGTAEPFPPHDCCRDSASSCMFDIPAKKRWLASLCVDKKKCSLTCVRGRACERVGEPPNRIRRMPHQAVPMAWGLPVPAPWSEDSTLLQSQATVDIPTVVDAVRSAYVLLPKQRVP